VTILVALLLLGIGRTALHGAAAFSDGLNGGDGFMG